MTKDDVIHAADLIEMSEACGLLLLRPIEDADVNGKLVLGRFEINGDGSHLAKVVITAGMLMVAARAIRDAADSELAAREAPVIHPVQIIEWGIRFCVSVVGLGMVYAAFVVAAVAGGW